MENTTRLSPQFIKIVYVKRFNVDSNFWVYINVNQIFGFRWVHEDLDKVWHIKLALKYIDNTDDIFWILPQEFEKLFTALTGQDLVVTLNEK